MEIIPGKETEALILVFVLLVIVLGSAGFFLGYSYGSNDVMNNLDIICSTPNTIYSEFPIINWSIPNEYESEKNANTTSL